MLIKDGAVADDLYTRIADGAPLEDGPVIVSLTRFLAEKESLLARGEPLGVVLETSESPDALEDAVRKIALIVLDVPHFKDGRAFSYARILRTRLNFQGEIRVTGHVLFDQIAYYARVGVNAFQLSQNLSFDDFNAALREISNVYQPAVDGRETISDLRTGRG
jgi:uncharacterized protein (DUF934 family)